MKSIAMLAAVLCAAAVTGCASVSLDGNGGGDYSELEPNDILQQMAKDSQGGDS